MIKLCNKIYVIYVEYYFFLFEWNVYVFVFMEMILVDNSFVGGLEKELMILINCRVMLIRNINID